MLRTQPASLGWGDYYSTTVSASGLAIAVGFISCIASSIFMIDGTKQTSAASAGRNLQLKVPF
jgi:hypothetical protein